MIQKVSPRILTSSDTTNVIWPSRERIANPIFLVALTGLVQEVEQIGDFLEAPHNIQIHTNANANANNMSTCLHVDAYTDLNARQPWNMLTHARAEMEKERGRGRERPPTTPHKKTVGGQRNSSDFPCGVHPHQRKKSPRSFQLC